MSTTFDFGDHVVLVTGASGSLGTTTVDAFHEGDVIAEVEGCGHSYRTSTGTDLRVIVIGTGRWCEKTQYVG